MSRRPLPESSCRCSCAVGGCCRSLPPEQWPRWPLPGNGRPCPWAARSSSCCWCARPARSPSGLLTRSCWCVSLCGGASPHSRRWRTLRRFSSMIRQKRSRPIGPSQLNSFRYMCHSFTPPMPGSLTRMPLMYSRANSSRAALPRARSSSYW